MQRTLEIPKPFMRRSTKKKPTIMHCLSHNRHGLIHIVCFLRRDVIKTAQMNYNKSWEELKLNGFSVKKVILEETRLKQ